MRKTAAILFALLTLAYAALHLPGRARLELYDVSDVTYCMDGPFLDISLATAVSLDPIVDVHLMMTGCDLAETLQLLVPGSDVPVQFQNGLLIVRGTAIQQLAVRAALAALRVRNFAVYAAIDGATRAKAALSARLFGMITR